METILRSPEGEIRLTDCMPVLPDAREESELQPLREILRRVEIREGHPIVEAHIDARPGYAKRRGTFQARGKQGWAMADRQGVLILTTDFTLSAKDGVLNGSHTGEEGEEFWFSLTFEQGNPGISLPIGAAAEVRLATTLRWWQTWSGMCDYAGEWREQVVRSAITLRLLTFTQSGALIAAATTSLPERKHGTMNWDYRYCWPRDAAVTLGAFIHIGLHKEADAFFDWLMLAAGNTRPRIAAIYDLFGRNRIKETKLTHLAGYDGAQPVRVGNAAFSQTQHDVYGEVMMAAEHWIEHFGKPLPSQRALIEGFGKALAATWRDPDSGIWEIRDELRHYTHSKVMAWYVFESLLKLHEQGLVDGPADLYRQERDALRTLIEREAFNSERDCFTATLGGDTVDAALLLLPRCGFVAYDDPRMVGTWNAIQRDIEQNGLILRYPPGFGGSEPGEGAFIICNLWAVAYLAGCGREAEAHERLTRLCGFANDVGLYNESVDPVTLEALGNMPQTFSHASFITTVMRFEQGTRPKQAAA